MMINVPHSVRIFLHVGLTDLRKGFDRLAGSVTTAFAQDPTCGHRFLFGNRRRDRLKILYWDRDGLAIWYKRLEAGSYQMPQATQDGIKLQPAELAMLLLGIDLRTARQRKRFQLAG
jgi:transposase